MCPQPPLHTHLSISLSCLQLSVKTVAWLKQRYIATGIVRFLSKSSIQQTMSDMVDVGIIVVFGINSICNAVRKCEIALGFASHYFTLPDCIARAIYRSLPSERPPLVYPPFPYFSTSKELVSWMRPPLVYPPPPPPPPSILLPVISHPTFPPCLMKCQNVRDISRGTWQTIVSAFTTLTAWSL